MSKTLTCEMIRLTRDSGRLVFAGFALKYRSRVLKEFYGRDGAIMTNRIGRWAKSNGFSSIRWIEPVDYVAEIS